jgi:AcrR family transcriptional regulator
MARRKLEEAGSAAATVSLVPRRLPLQARARDRVDRILSATLELLEEQGADPLSTGAIAERAQIPIGSVYHYFPSKEAVLAELAERKFRAVDASLAKLLGQELERRPWREALGRAIDGVVAAFRSDPSYVTIWRAIRGSSAFRGAAAASDARLADSIAALPLLQAVPPSRLQIALPTAIRIANTFLDWVLETPDPRVAAGVLREMKRALVAYLAEDLDAAQAAHGPRLRRRRSPRGRRRSR